MEKKETKVKKFYHKNKEKIAKFAWFVIGGTIGCCSMAYALRGTSTKFTVDNSRILKVLEAAQNEFGAGKMTIYSGWETEGLTTDKLGKLGEVINSIGGNDNVFKYFIAIGPDKE